MATYNDDITGFYIASDTTALPLAEEGAAMTAPMTFQADAAAGINVLITGSGADTLIAGVARIAWQRVRLSVAASPLPTAALTSLRRRSVSRRRRRI